MKDHVVIHTSILQTLCNSLLGILCSGCLVMYQQTTDHKCGPPLTLAPDNHFTHMERVPDIHWMGGNK